MTPTRFVRFHLGIVALLAALPAAADTRFQVRRMARNDVPFGKGQCDIRLQVDGDVEVTVRGDSVLIRTISGRDAHDDGSECNEPLPRDAQNFNFDVRDSRGGIRLIAEPSYRDGGAAIVRIRDSSGGMGRYHFRLSWTIGGGRDRGLRDDDRDRRPPIGGGGGWNRRVYFTGRGDGSYFHGGFGRHRIYNVVVRLDPNGTVSVNFERERGGRLNFTGRVHRFTGDEVTADVVGGDGDILRGSMIILLNSRDRVSEINMSGRDGRERFEVRWRD